MSTISALQWGNEMEREKNSFFGQEGEREGNNKINVPKVPLNFQKGGKTW